MFYEAIVWFVIILVFKRTFRMDGELNAGVFLSL